VDYIVWRRFQGQSGIGLPADGSGNGSIGPEDYDVWTANLGSSTGAAATTIAMYPVPEPSTGVPMAVSLMLIYAQRLGRPVPSGQECGAR
jgi:hypothetical protein